MNEHQLMSNKTNGGERFLNVELSLTHYFVGVFSLLVVWIACLRGLMIADVWDETNFILGVHGRRDQGLSLFDGIVYVWSHSISLYRPLATTLLLVLDRVGLDFVGLRYVNAFFLCVSALVLANLLIRHFQAGFLKALFFVFLFLFSASVLISAAWFANIFDVTCLALLVLSFSFLMNERWVWAGVAAGCAFFCKEAAVLFVGLLFMASPARPFQWKGRLLALAIAASFGGVYFFVRGVLIPFGSSADIRVFDWGLFPGSSLAFLSAFWFQSTRFSEFGTLACVGLLAFAGGVWAVRRSPHLIVLQLLTLGMATLMYCGMVSYQGDRIVDYQNFVGRLFLIPFTVFLFHLASVRGGRGLLLVAIPVVLGWWQTYGGYREFQSLYASMYQKSMAGSDVLRIHYPEKPLSDPARKLEIGDYPDSDFCIDKRSAALIPCAKHAEK